MNDLQPSAFPGHEGFADEASVQSLELSLRDKQICFVVPAGARLDAISLHLPGGMLVLGALRGKVICSQGAIIIAKGGEFQGDAEAHSFFIEGVVTSPAINSNRVTLSKLTAREKRTRVDGIDRVEPGLIAISSHATICAHMRAQLFEIPRNANLNRSILESI